MQGEFRQERVMPFTLMVFHQLVSDTTYVGIGVKVL